MHHKARGCQFQHFLTPRHFCSSPTPPADLSPEDTVLFFFLSGNASFHPGTFTGCPTALPLGRCGIGQAGHNKPAVIGGNSCSNLINSLHFIQSEGPSNVRLPRSYMHGDNRAEVCRKSSQEEQEGSKELHLKHHDDEQKAIQIPNNTHQLFHPGLQAPRPAVLVNSSSPSSPLLYSLHAPRELGTYGDT